MSMPEGYGMDLCCSIGGGGGGQSLNQPLDCQLTDWHLFCPILSSMRKFSEPEPAPKVRKPRAEEVFTRRPEELFLCRAPNTQHPTPSTQASGWAQHPTPSPLSGPNTQHPTPVQGAYYIVYVMSTQARRAASAGLGRLRGHRVSAACSGC